MKKFFFIVFLLSSTFAKGSGIISAWDFKEIYNLYFDQQYDVVKAKMRSMGYELKSEVPEYSYDGINYMGEFIFTKEYTDQIYEHGIYNATRTIEFKFKSNIEYSILKSYIEFKSSSTKPENYFVDNLIDIWLQDIPNNRIINTVVGFETVKQLMIRDTSNVCGKIDIKKNIINCRNPAKDYRVFMDVGNSLYSSIHGFMINNKALHPIDNIELYIAKLKKKSIVSRRLTTKHGVRRHL